RRRQEAEQHYELARAAVERYFTRVSEDRLLNEPHMEGLRKDLLETAGEFYRRLVAERRGDRRARAALAQGHLRLAALTEATESHDAAIEHAGRALALFEELDRAWPGTPRFRRGLADSHSSLGNLYGHGRAAQAEEAFRQAVALWEAVARDGPRDESVR